MREETNDYTCAREMAAALEQRTLAMLAAIRRLDIQLRSDASRSNRILKVEADDLSVVRFWLEGSEDTIGLEVTMSLLAGPDAPFRLVVVLHRDGEFTHWDEPDPEAAMNRLRDLLNSGCQLQSAANHSTPTQ